MSTTLEIDLGKAATNQPKDGATDRLTLLRWEPQPAWTQENDQV